MLLCKRCCRIALRHFLGLLLISLWLWHLCFHHRPLHRTPHLGFFLNPFILCGAGFASCVVHPVFYVRLSSTICYVLYCRQIYQLRGHFQELICFPGVCRCVALFVYALERISTVSFWFVSRIISFCFLWRQFCIHWSVIAGRSHPVLSYSLLINMGINKKCQRMTP